MKRGIGAAVGGWAIYLLTIYNMIDLEIPAEYSWITQIVTVIPLILGHSYLVHRIHVH